MEVTFVIPWKIEFHAGMVSIPQYLHKDFRIFIIFLFIAEIYDFYTNCILVASLYF
jgi:hypothetical protein